MQYVRKTFVEFFFRGAFFNGSSIREVESRDISQLSVPEDAFGFIFFDRFFTVVNFEGQDIPLRSQRLNETPMHYYGGKLYTISQIKRAFPHLTSLIGNLKSSGCKKAVLCRAGNWHPFDDEVDIFISLD